MCRNYDYIITGMNQNSIIDAYGYEIQKDLNYIIYSSADRAKVGAHFVL